MTETNCNVCLTDKTLTFVSVANTTLTSKKFKIEAVDHDRLYACLDKDPSATLEGTVFSTCLTERDPCKSPTVSVNDIRMAGNWTVELEDGTLIENKSLEELSELLLEHEILLKIPPSISLTCSDFTDIPNYWEISGDLNYYDDEDDRVREWELYVNGEYFGVTGQDDDTSWMEQLSDLHPLLTGNYDSGIIITNESSQDLSIAFVAVGKTPLSELGYTLVNSNPSYSHDIESGVIKFCLSGMSNK